jgi:CheY-like chemotaxis protein
VLLQEVIEHAIEGARPLVAGRRQSVAFDPPPQPLKVDGDPIRLAQVIGNLLSNAAKFSPDGARIHVTAARVNGMVQIGVRDAGAGIDAQILPHVFDLFVQGDQSLDRSQGGLGIGLTIAKRLVELHGGRIEVRSDGPGRGSEFTITLPSGALADRKEAAQPAAAMTSRRVLVVDDNTDSATSLSVLLEMEGHEVRSAPNGPAALHALEHFGAHVVLLDLGLPGLDGYATADLIRERCGTAVPYLVALSGYGPPANPNGFDAHLTKPLELAHLGEILQRLPAAQPLLSR